jgi:DnaK suppressor protein
MSHLTKEFIEKQRKLLLSQKSSILNHMKLNEIEDLRPDPDQIVEEVEKGQVYASQSLSMNLRERELKNLHEIEEALYRIEVGSYGICEETGEEITIARLEKIPWVRLSVEAQEEIERSQMAA